MISSFRFQSVAVFAALLVLSTSTPGCQAQSTLRKPQGSATTQQGSATTPQGSATTQQGSGSATKSAPHPALTDPSLANKTAPEKFFARFSTTKGDFVVEVTRELSPNGADRFYNMVDVGYFQNIAIFRAIPGFMFQFGVHGDPSVSKHWSKATIKDDAPGKASNLPGFLTFAKTGLPNSRSAQIFINLGNNASLDRQGFTPFGKVVEGLDVVAKINTEYGENDRSDQAEFTQKGNEWLLKKYPRLDIIKSVTFVEAK
jgi:peptidyl-prolyl cis-trans isomerase A (cyclophilin A)